MSMLPYEDKAYRYKDALDLKYPEDKAIAKTHNARQTTINMTFDSVDDVAEFTSAVFKGDKKKVYMIEPNFLNPRKANELFHDYSANCIIM